MPNIVFTDSMDHYSLADMGKKYLAGPAGVASFVAGRTGNALSLGGATSVSLAIPASQTVYVEAAMSWNSFASSTQSLLLLDAGGVLHLDLRTMAAGELQITRNGTPLATTSGLGLLTNTWYHIGLYGLIDDTTGAYELRVNGVTKLTATNVDTRSPGSASVGIVRMSNNVAGVVTLFDDLIVSTDGFCGDCRVQALFPQGAGHYSQWTPSTESGWQCVDDPLMNSDTDYVSGATGGHRNSYDFAAAGAGSVIAVQHVVAARKTDAGSRSMKQFARVGSADYEPATAASVTDTYLMHRRVMTVNPATGTAWTVAQLDAAEFGTKLES